MAEEDVRGEVVPDHNSGDGEKGVKTETLVLSPLEDKIVRQVEFYFGDRNLPRDKFMQQTIASNEGGWIPLTTLLTFNRLKTLSSDKAFVTSALKKSRGVVFEVSDDGEGVRRSPSCPLPDNFTPEQRKEIRDKTVYVKGFAEDSQLDEIQQFFEQYGKTQYIQMRKTNPPDRKFKGSVFVEFCEKEDFEKFLHLDVVMFRDKELLRESKEMYFKRKQEERKKAKEEKRQAEQQRQEEARRRRQVEQEEVKVKTTGCVLHFSGCGPDTSREDLKEVFQEFATVAFVEFVKGDTEGYIRFQEENGAKRALDGLSNKAEGGGSPQICGADTELRVLEGEEEEGYWEKVLESKGNKKGRKKPGRGGGGGWRRKRKSQEGLPAAKHPKTEENHE